MRRHWLVVPALSFLAIVFERDFAVLFVLPNATTAKNPKNDSYKSSNQGYQGPCSHHVISLISLAKRVSDELISVVYQGPGPPSVRY